MKAWPLLLVGMCLIGFSLPSHALASQNSKSATKSCTLNGANGSPCNPDRVTGPQCYAHVTGQAFFASGEGYSSNAAANPVYLCLSPNASSGSGYCKTHISDGSLFNVSMNTFPNPQAAYTWGTVYVMPNSNPDVQAGWGCDITTTGRVAEIQPGSAVPNPIYGGDATVVSYTTADGYLTGFNEDDGACGGRPAENTFHQLPSGNPSYTYQTLNSCSGITNFQGFVFGPDANGNAVYTYLPQIPVVVNKLVTVDAKCNGSDGPCGVNYGSNFTLSWTSGFATSCTTTGPGVSQSGLSGSVLVGPITASGQVYTTTCTNGPTTRSDSVTININAPTVNLKCGTPASDGPCTVPSGSTSLLSWTSTGATVCTASNGWSGSKTPVGAGSEASPPITQAMPGGRQALYKPALAMREEVINKLLGIDTAQASSGPDNDGQVWIHCNNTGGPCTVPYGGSVELEMTSHHPNGAGSWAANCSADWPDPGYGQVPAGRNYNETLTGLTASRVYGFRCSSAVAFSADFVTVNVAAPVANAAFVTHNLSSIPAYLNVGTSYPVTVTMQNNGDKTWTAATNYKLGSQNPQSNAQWGTARVLLAPGDSIAPGQSKTFSFNLTPAAAGSFNLQWQMLQEGVTWFGALTPNVPLNVLAAGAKAFTLTCTNPAGGSASDTVIVQSGPNQNPVGSLDCAGAACNGVNNMAGWTYDPDATTTPIQYSLYIDGTPGSCGAGCTAITGNTTSVLRADVNTFYSITGNHGFSFPIPAQYFDNNNHTVHAYGINTPAGTNPELTNSPRTFKIAPTPTPTPTPTATPTPVTIPIIKEVTPH